MSTTASRNGTYMTGLKEMASKYLRDGLPVVPVRFRAKNPIPTDWTRIRAEDVDLDATFPVGQQFNIGCLLGEPAGNIVDVDLDAPEAVAVADRILPSTGWVFGRAGKRRSHWLYRVDVAGQGIRGVRRPT